MRNLFLKKQSTFTKKDHSKVRFLIKTLVMGSVLMLLALFYIWSRVEVVKMGYEIGELQREQKEWKSQNQKLKLELSVLKAPQRIETIATEKLHMVWPTPSHVYQISSGTAGEKQ